MNSKNIEIPIESTHRVIRYTLFSSDSIYKDALEQAPILAEQLNDYDPSGNKRTPEVKETVAFSGYIAEAIVIEEINKQLKQLIQNDHLKDIIEAHPVSANTIEKNKDSFDQIDIQVTNKSTGNYKTIEVRSSNIYKVKDKDNEVYNQDQSLIGSYSTKNKAGEIKKDFYVTLFFRHSQDTLTYIKKNNYGLTVDIAGAASRELLEVIGTQSNLKQNGANYLVIKPIIKSNSIYDIVSEIYNCLKSNK